MEPVTKFSFNGILDAPSTLRTKEYKNTWPESDSVLKSNNSVYYYSITSPNEAVQRGSITIVR